MESETSADEELVCKEEIKIEYGIILKQEKHDEGKNKVFTENSVEGFTGVEEYEKFKDSLPESQEKCCKKQIASVASCDSEDESAEDIAVIKSNVNFSGVDKERHTWLKAAEKDSLIIIKRDNEENKERDVVLSEETSDLEFCHIQGIFRGPRCPKRIATETPVTDPDSDPLASITFLYCDDCDNVYDGDCPEHGPLLVVDDVLVPVNINDKFRAEKTSPRVVCLSIGGKPEASGVWAKENIPMRTRFGPYEGQIIPLEECTEYSWVVHKDNRPDHCIDASEKGLSNWMRFVKCAKRNCERNLDAFQYQGNIYYKTIRQVNREEELLVWFGESPWSRAEVEVRRGDAVDETITNREISMEEETLRCREDQPSCSCRKCTQLFPDREATELRSTPHGESRKQASLVLHSKKNYFACPQCDKLFTTKKVFEAHMLSHSGRKPFKCNMCTMRFSWRIDLRKHKLDKHTRQRYGCAECKRVFSFVRDLEIHSMTHKEKSGTGASALTGEGGMPPTSNDRESYLQRQSLLYLGVNLYQCFQCDVQFNRKSSLLKHQKEFHEGGGKEFMCSECNAAFYRKSNLTRHERIHLNEKLLACSDCGLRFSKHNLKKHRVIHIRPNSCPECYKVISNKANLERHLRKHKVRKRFEFVDCGEFVC